MPYLDYEGLKYLWSKISMKDYPNNETLIAVLNAIDATKLDKSVLSEILNILFENVKKPQPKKNFFSPKRAISFRRGWWISIFASGNGISFPESSEK